MRSNPASINESGSAPETLEQLIRKAEAAGASDIHLQMNGEGAQVAFRLDGLMTPSVVIEKNLAERVFGRIKFLARLKTYQESLPQDGRIDRKDIGARNEIRVATYPAITGEKIVLRLFASKENKTLEQLELSPDACGEIKAFLQRQSGLLLLTGPAGSGKTTTIYACLRQLAQEGSRHVITVEDPVEQIIPGIMQTEISEARGLDFATAARHLLRQDPQVLVLGEIRDDQTANLAVRAALTGHMVIATLHAGSCKGVLERLMVMCRDHYAVISALEMIVNQRLIRKLCPSCSGKGCSRCLNTGYQGRIPIVEWIRLNDPLRQEIRHRGPEAIVPAEKLADSARRLLEKNLTDATETQRLLG